MSACGIHSYEFNNIQSTSSPNLKFLLYWAHLFSPSQPLLYILELFSVEKTQIWRTLMRFLLLMNWINSDDYFLEPMTNFLSRYSKGKVAILTLQGMSLVLWSSYLFIFSLKIYYFSLWTCLMCRFKLLLLEQTYLQIEHL